MTLGHLGGPSVITGPYEGQREKEDESGVGAGCHADGPEDRGRARHQGGQVPLEAGKGTDRDSSLEVLEGMQAC